MKIYTLSRRQYNIISGICYAAADLHYIAEKYGVHDPEFKAAEKNLDLWMDEATYISAPAALVNHALAYAENWRRYSGGQSFDEWIKNERSAAIRVAV